MSRITERPKGLNGGGLSRVCGGAEGAATRVVVPHTHPRGAPKPQTKKEFVWFGGKDPAPLRPLFAVNTASRSVLADYNAPDVQSVSRALTKSIYSVSNVKRVSNVCNCLSWLGSPSDPAAFQDSNGSAISPCFSVWNTHGQDPKSYTFHGCIISNTKQKVLGAMATKRDQHIYIYIY